MNTTSRWAALAFTGVILSGCAQLPEQLDRLADDLRSFGNGSFKAAPTAFSQSGLPGIFAGTAYTDGWPRVALTIEAMPPSAFETWHLWTIAQYSSVPYASVTRVPRDFCITVSATVWTDAKTSRKIPTVPYCGADTAPNGVTNDYMFELLGWGEYPKTGVRHTGSKRTEGPNPPERSLPGRTVIINGGNTQGSLIFAHLLNSMGLDLSRDYLKEYRLWVVQSAR